MKKATIQPGNFDDFTLVTGFTYGYRHREDKTTLAPGVLVVGSQNVLTNTSGRVAVTKGYSLDGASSTVLAPILSSYDWQMHTGEERHLRAGFLTSAGNDGKLQYRYVDSSGTVTWRDLVTGLSSTTFNFTDWWDNTAFQAHLLFVNGSSNIYEWSGGVTTLASAGINTLTKSGTSSWAEAGFYNTGTRKVVVNGVEYTYTGGEGTTQLTGVTPDPSLASPAIVSGDVVHQAVKITANSSMTGIPATFANSLIANLQNQIYVGSLVANQMYVSKVNVYTNFTFTTPVRVVGEGAILTLDGTPVALVPQEDSLYISAGKDQWYQTQFTLSADLTKEDLTVSRLKTTTQQAAQSQALCSKIRNNIVYVSFEPILNSLGRVNNVVLTPQVSDLSYPIIVDMNSYDFTDGSVFYYRNYIYVAVPREGLIRVYNMTNASDSANSDVSDPNFYWEAPLTIPVSRFSIIDGELYGHSYQTSESYKLFDGYNFNNAPIDARAVFSYNNYGTRSYKKGFNEFYSEGYISPGTTLTLTNTYEMDGCANQASYNLVGDNSQFVCVLNNDASLGKSSLGKNPLGSSLTQTSANSLPPKFRWIRTFPVQYFYEHQITYSSLGVDQQWEILACGPQLLSIVDTNTNIKE